MGSFRETVWPLPGCLAGWLRDLHQDKTDPGRCRFQSPVASGSGGMIMIALTLSSMFALAFAAPAPQELTVTVGDSSEGVEEPGPVVVVVDSSDGGPLDFGGLGGFGDFGRFPGFNPQQFSGFGDFPSRLPSSYGFEDESTPEISIDLSEIFGSQPSGDGSRVPGIINTIFDALGGHLGVQISTDGGEGTVSLHGAEGDGEYDHHNSTFDEKVLPDGSVVRVNRTTIKDTDENGNSFFFSSSVHHVLQEGDAEEESEEEIPNDEEEDIPADVGEDFNAVQYDEEAELVPTDIDETKNEVPDESENEIEREAKYGFDGTDATASVEDIF